MQRDKVKRQYPDARSNADVGRILSRQWKQMPAAHRRKYDVASQIEMIEFKPGPSTALSTLRIR